MLTRAIRSGMAIAAIAAIVAGRARRAGGGTGPREPGGDVLEGFESARQFGGAWRPATAARRLRRFRAGRTGFY